MRAQAGQAALSVNSVEGRLSGSQTMWFVYIVKCRNKAFYTGITDNIERRVRAHNAKKGGYYTRAFGPVKLVWKEQQPDRSSATKREIQIKRWPRVRKEALIEGASNRIAVKEE